jgi:hypothetical protein
MKQFFQRAFAANSIAHGVLIAFLTALFALLMPMLQSGHDINSTDVVIMFKSATAAGLMYLFKNGFFGTSENPLTPTV